MVVPSRPELGAGEWEVEVRKSLETKNSVER
jgi:hypothetical protein